MKKLILYFALCAITYHAYSQNIVRGEYFIDSDPGFGHATEFTISPASDINQAIDIPYAAFSSPGYHYLFFRTKDENGTWGITGKRYVEVDDNANSLNIVRVEYFFSGDNGFGNNSFVQLDDPEDQTWNFNIPFNQLPVKQSANDTLFLRIEESNGQWSQTTMIDSINYIMVGIDELPSTAGISVYPNPFTDRITVSSKNSGKARLVLYDESGRLMLSKVIEQTTELNTSNLVPGTYIVFLFTDRNKLFRSTLTKQ